MFMDRAGRGTPVSPERISRINAAPRLPVIALGLIPIRLNSDTCPLASSD